MGVSGLGSRVLGFGLRVVKLRVLGAEVIGPKKLYPWLVSPVMLLINPAYTQENHTSINHHRELNLV